MNYKEYLCNDVLEFWLSNAIDNINGGIFTSLDKKGIIYGKDKSVWFQGRGTLGVCAMKQEILVLMSAVYGGTISIWKH